MGTAIRLSPLSRLAILLPTDQDLRAAIKGMLPIYLPELTDRNAASDVTRLADLLGAFWAKHVLGYLQAIVNEGFLATASQWDFLAARAQEHGYAPSPGNAAHVTLTLTRKRTSLYPTVFFRTISSFRTKRIGTITDPVTFRMVEDSVTVPAGIAGTQVSFDAVQGAYVLSESLGTGDGSPLQEFITSQARAVQDTEKVTLLGPEPGAIEETCDLTDNLLLCGADDLAYERRWDEDGHMILLFGTGAYGRKPIGTLTISYLVIPDSQDGNVPAGSITDIVPQASEFMLTNQAAAEGWEAPDSADDIRFKGMRSARVQRNCIDEDDTPALVERDFADVGRCYYVAGEYGENTAGVHLCNEDGSNIEQSLIDQVQAYVEARNPATELIIVGLAEWTDVDIVATVNVKDGFTPALVLAAVEVAVLAWLSPAAVDSAGNRVLYPGQILYPSEIVSIMSAVSGVASVTLVEPAVSITGGSAKLLRPTVAVTEE